MVADALSKNMVSMVSITLILAEEWPLAMYVYIFANNSMIYDIIEPNRIFACIEVHLFWWSILSLDSLKKQIYVIQDKVLKDESKE